MTFLAKALLVLVGFLTGGCSLYWFVFFVPMLPELFGRFLWPFGMLLLTGFSTSWACFALVTSRLRLAAFLFQFTGAAIVIVLVAVWLAGGMEPPGSSSIWKLFGIGLVCALVLLLVGQAIRTGEGRLRQADAMTQGPPEA